MRLNHSTKGSSNLLQRLEKRIEKQLITDEKGNPLVHIHALPDISRAVAQTEFLDGVQKVAVFPQTIEETNSNQKTVTMVLPDAIKTNQTFRSVRLRNKQTAENFEKTPHAIFQISAEETEIIERMTNLDCQFDVSSLKCLMPERILGNRRGRKEDGSPEQCGISFDSLRFLACHMVLF